MWWVTVWLPRHSAAGLVLITMRITSDHAAPTASVSNSGRLIKKNANQSECWSSPIFIFMPEEELLDVRTNGNYDTTKFVSEPCAIESWTYRFSFIPIYSRVPTLTGPIEEPSILKVPTRKKALRLFMSLSLKWDNFRKQLRLNLILWVRYQWNSLLVGSESP